MTTPENITNLQPHEIFVFGSNLNGNHAGGAAAYAKELFGAVEGIGQGITGQCYALPTLDRKMQPMRLHILALYRDNFYLAAVHWPGKTFLLTKVGCGIAGYSEETMRELFRVKLSNVVYPKGW